MRLESIQNMATTEFRKIDKSKKDESKKAAKYPRKSDKASLSSDARQLSETKANEKLVSARLQAEPDIRTDKIAEVQKKLDDGFYNSAKFADQLADKLINDMF